MAVKLYQRGFDHAKSLVTHGRCVYDERDDWSEHQPTAAEENAFIEEHGIEAFGEWHLGIDDEMDRDTKGRYKFPYGDFRAVHRCALLAAESRAAQRKYSDIEDAVKHLHGMLEGKAATPTTQRSR